MLGDTESGHYTLHWKFSVGKNTENKKHKIIKLIRRANFEAISADFSSVNWTKELNDFNAEQSNSKFHDFYNKTCEKNIPKVRERVKKSSEIWMTREVKDAVREKHQSWYRLKMGESRSNYHRSCKK